MGHWFALYASNQEGEWKTAVGEGHEVKQIRKAQGD